MDAIRALAVTAKASVQGAKAGRAYVRAIRQLFLDVLKQSGDAESDYYASRLGRAEEGGEALEPRSAADRFGRCACGSTSCAATVETEFYPLDRCHSCWCAGCNPDAWWMVTCADCGDKRCPRAASHEYPCQRDSSPAAPTVESRMECESVDAAEPVVGAFVFGCNEALPLPNIRSGGKTTSDRCARPLCDHTRYVHIPDSGCDVDAHYKVPPCSCPRFMDSSAATLDPSTAADDSQTAAVEDTTAVPRTVTRVVLVHGDGGSNERWAESWDLAVQDDGRTLKLFAHNPTGPRYGYTPGFFDMPVGVTPTPKPTEGVRFVDAPVEFRDGKWWNRPQHRQPKK